jgi:citrate lyase subunit beta/citryl-CoA lyase
MGGRALQPARVALFAPGSNERVMTKAMASGAEAVILDLEDSVPLNAKAEARALAAMAIDAAARPGPAIYVRVNGAASAFLAEDLAAVVRPRSRRGHAAQGGNHGGGAAYRCRH